MTIENNIAKDIVEDFYKNYKTLPSKKCEAIEYLIQVLREEGIRSFERYEPDAVSLVVFDQFFSFIWSPRHPTYFLVTGIIGESTISFATGSEEIRRYVRKEMLRTEI